MSLNREPQKPVFLNREAIMPGLEIISQEGQPGVIVEADDSGIVVVWEKGRDRKLENCPWDGENTKAATLQRNPKKQNINAELDRFYTASARVKADLDANPIPEHEKLQLYVSDSLMKAWAKRDGVINSLTGDIESASERE